MITITSGAGVGGSASAEGELFHYNAIPTASIGAMIIAWRPGERANPAHALMTTANDLPIIGAITEFLSDARERAREKKPQHLPPIDPTAFFHAAADIVTGRRLDIEGLEAVGLAAAFDTFRRFADRNKLTYQMPTISREHGVAEIKFMESLQGVIFRIRTPPALKRSARWYLLENNKRIDSGNFTANTDVTEALLTLQGAARARGVLEPTEMAVTRQKEVAEMLMDYIDAEVPTVPLALPGRRGMTSLIDGPPR